MNINSQHHNLLGNQISPKSEDFCIWRHFVPWLPWQRPPFWICSTSQKLPHTTVDIPTKWIIIWRPNHGYQFPTSKSTWKPNFAQIGGFLYLSGHFAFKMAAIANQRWISIRNIIIYLETKFRPNRRIFVFDGHFVPWLPWQRPPFWIYQHPKSCHTLRWIFLQSFMKFDERNPKCF